MTLDRSLVVPGTIVCYEGDPWSGEVPFDDPDLIARDFTMRPGHPGIIDRNPSAKYFTVAWVGLETECVSRSMPHQVERDGTVHDMSRVDPVTWSELVQELPPYILARAKAFEQT